MPDVVDAHAFSANHRAQLQKDQRCGCFYCCSVFEPREITQWVGDIAGTAICPYCGIDSVIGESSGYPITEVFLMQMKQYWF